MEDEYDNSDPHSAAHPEAVETKLDPVSERRSRSEVDAGAAVSR